MKRRSSSESGPLNAQIADCPSLVELLRHRARHQPDHAAFNQLSEQGEVIETLSFAELDRRARSIAGALLQRGLCDQHIVLVFRPGLEFIAAYFGCLYARAVSIAVPPPEPTRLQRTMPRLLGVLKDAAPAAMLVTDELAARMPELGPELARVPCLSLGSCLTFDAERWHPQAVGRETLTHLQYTSGSTSRPKGTLITHGNMLRNLEDLRRAKRYDSSSIALCWVPHYHDDGMVQGIALPVYSGHRSYLMAAQTLVARPERWLQAISRHRVTHAGGPNFTYELCLRKVSSEQCAGLDLSSWTMAYNAAEPVRAETLRRFFERFQQYGFRWSSFVPAYGMAETTLTISAHTGALPLRILACDVHALERDGRIRTLDAGAPGSRELVSCGPPVGETRVEIADPVTRRKRGVREVGEIWVQSPAVARGYFGLPEETRAAFAADIADTGDGPFFRTGDLGFFDAGELFITGRAKDMIIVRGENRYPQDLELTTETCHPAIRPGGVAAFSIEHEREERPVIVAEIRATQRGSENEAPEVTHAAIANSVQAAIASAHGVEVHAVALLRPGALPKTSSGKVQRAAARAAYLEGSLSEVYRTSRASHAPRFEPNAPANVNELAALMVSQIVERTGLAESEVSLDSPIMRFGLDSVGIVSVLAALSDRLGRTVETGAYDDQLSIRELVRALSAEVEGRNVEATRPHAASSKLLVELRPIVARQPLYWVGGLTGLVKNLWPLACFLPDERPLFALHTPGLHGAETPARNIEALAARLLDEVRSVQPNGPYLFAGHSFGGFVAYEMAQQVRQEDEDVSRVILLDTTRPEPGQSFTGISRALALYEVMNLMQQFLEHSDFDGAPYEAFIELHERDQSRLVAKVLRAVGIRLEGTHIERLVEVVQASVEAVHRYQPAPADFPVTLFRAAFHIPEIVPNSRVPLQLETSEGLGWERVCPNLEIRHVPGDHLTLIQHPHLRTLVRTLANVLRGCDASVSLRAAEPLPDVFPYRHEA